MKDLTSSIKSLLKECFCLFKMFIFSLCFQMFFHFITFLYYITMDANNKFNRMRRILIRANFNRTAAVRMYRETYPDDIPAPSRQSFRR